MRKLVTAFVLTSALAADVFAAPALRAQDHMPSARMMDMMGADNSGGGMMAG
jgi:hypothetical protein